MFEKIILEQNPHWNSQLYPQVFTRDIFAKLLDFLPLPHIVGVSGARRVGKSTILKQLINHLITKEKVPADNIFFMNLENPFLVEYANDVRFLQMIFEEYIGMKNPQGLIYCFLDEVKFFKNWPVFIKALYERKKVKFFITGSNDLELLVPLACKAISFKMSSYH